eukprot:jgi/Botrbrau1/22523/Bobra.114_2s0048.1
MLDQRPIALLLLLKSVAGALDSMPPGLAPSLALAATAPSDAQHKDMNLLFIQQAKSGALRMNDSAGSKGILVLDGVSDHAVWFADRPDRTAGQVEVSFFTGSNFTDAKGDWLSKPNAALYISNPGPSPNNDMIVIVTLSSPTYNQSSRSITYQAEIVPPTNRMLETGAPKRDSLLKSYLEVAADPTTPNLVAQVENGSLAFGSAVLFIDHWGWGWGPGCGWWGWRRCGWGGWGWCWGW